MFLIVGHPEAEVAVAEEDVEALEEATSTQIHMQDFLQKSLLSWELWKVICRNGKALTLVAACKLEVETLKAISERACSVLFIKQSHQCMEQNTKVLLNLDKKWLSLSKSGTTYHIDIWKEKSILVFLQLFKI